MKSYLILKMWAVQFLNVANNEKLSIFGIWDFVTVFACYSKLYKPDEPRTHGQLLAYTLEV